MFEDDGARFQKGIGRIRMALLSTPISGAALQVGLLMLEHTNRRVFLKTGEAYSWLSKRKLAALAGLKLNTVKVARTRLAEEGVIVVHDAGGKGPRSTTTYAFNWNWVDMVEAQAKARLDVLRDDKNHPLDRDDDENRDVRDDKNHPLGVTPITLRGENHDRKGVTPITPNLLIEPLKEPIEGEPSEHALRAPLSDRKTVAAIEPQLQWGELVNVIAGETRFRPESVSEILLTTNPAIYDEISNRSTPTARRVELFQRICKECPP